jgi:hypothetical protein
MESVPKKRVARKRALVKPPVPPTSKARVSSTRAPKKDLVQSKKVATKKAAPQKRVTAKSATSRVKASVARVGTTTARAAKSPEISAPVPSRSFLRQFDLPNLPDSEQVSFIPGTVSKRLAEKVALYESWFKDESPRYAHKAANTFGYIFITFGFAFAILFSAHTTWSQSGLFAAITCSLGTECTTTVETMNGGSTTPTTLELPLVEFITSPVVVPEQNTDIVVSVKNTLEHQFYFVSRETGAKSELNPIGTDGAQMYTYRVLTHELPPGEYRVFVRATARDTHTISEFAGPTLLVPLPVPETMPTSTTTESIDEDSRKEVSSTTTASSVSEVLEVITPDNSTSTVALSVIEAQGDIEMEDAPEVDSETTTQSVTPEEVTTDAMTVSLVPGVFPRQYKLAIAPTYNYSSIELYVRPENAIMTQFLGVASKTSNGWLYWLDAAVLPSGTYKILVRGMDNETVKESVEIRFVNLGTKTMYQEEPTYTVEKEAASLETAKIVAATTSPLARFSSPTTDIIPLLLSSSNSTASSAPLLDEEREKAQEILTTYSDEFNAILRSYASAFQSGDQNVLRLSETALSEKVYESLAEKVRDTEFEKSIFTLETAIRFELDAVIEQIKRVEEFKKERTALASTEDTDDDGVTDYDEYLLYGTDPKSPDTDTDGVTDGVEISQGFDPLDEKPEAVIRFNSPKEVSYEDPTLLAIEEVAPLLVYEDEAEPASIQSEIKGYGLPNSFVTLYIFSEPIVATVKTKDDGSFSYTFTKELEDGKHEVYAALTDNKGHVVVRSAAFTFEKTAEIYTYADAMGEAPVTFPEEGLTAHGRAYNLVAAMGVISFGLILLLLAFTLRREAKLEVASAV